MTCSSPPPSASICSIRKCCCASTRISRRLDSELDEPNGARRTFVSLSLADGARRDILRWITHGPEGDIVSLYATLPWDALCAEVSKLRVEVRRRTTLEVSEACGG